MTTLQSLQHALGPRVYNCRHGQAPADAVNIMRPGKWGNLFVIGPDGTRTEVIAKHRAWLPTQPHLMASLHELRGRDLLCCCAPDACHGDTLLEFANGPPQFQAPQQPVWICSCDYETWSEADLKKMGARAYAQHPSTRILMMAWHIHGDACPPELWLPGMPFPEKLAWVIHNGGFLCGWNSAEFERHVWKHKAVPLHGWPEVADESWIDVMHLAAHANVPRSLDGASMAVGGPKKDAEGHKLMLELTSAKRTPREMLFDGEALKIHPKLQAKWERFCSYCKDDVRAEEGVAARLPPWPNVAPWHRIPMLDRRINDRGVLMDVQLVAGLNRAALAETARLDTEMFALTGGAVKKTSNVPSLKPWLMDLGVKLPLIRDKKDEEDGDPEDDGEDIDPDENKPDAKYRLRKSDIVDLLVDPNLPEPARLALTWRMEAAKASAKKLDRMLACVGADGRLRGHLALGGAQQTMRWCLAEGHPVTVLRGCEITEVPVQTVRLSDQVWDGDSWVQHEGVVFSGWKRVIEHDGVRATADHKVFISDREKVPLGEAKHRGLAIFKGNALPRVHAHLAVGEAIHRFDSDDAGSAVAGSRIGCAESPGSPAHTGCHPKTRPESLHPGHLGGWIERAAGEGNGDRADPGTQDDRPALWLQPDERRRDAGCRSSEAVLDSAESRSGAVRAVPTAVERQRQGWPAHAAYPRPSRSSRTVASRKPGAGATAGCEATGSVFAVRSEAPVDPSSKAHLVAAGAVGAAQFAGAPTAQRRGSETDVGGAHRGGTGGRSWADLGWVASAYQGPGPGSEGGAQCAATGGASRGRRDETQGASEGGLGRLLDARATCGEGGGNEGPSSDGAFVRTYDILNAGPRNRFLAAGRIVSNSGKDWQCHNFPRNPVACGDEIEELYRIKPKDNPAEFDRLSNMMLSSAIEAGRSGDIELIRTLFTRTYKDSYGRTIREEVLPFVSRMLRRTLGAAIRHLLQNGDYAQIEARIPVWLAGQTNMVEAFARGEDVYRIAAAPVFNLSPAALSKLQRQIGKVMILSLGFAGGVGALIPMGMNYGVTIPREDGLKYVYAFRENNAALVQYWDNLLAAAINAVYHPGATFEVAPTNLIAFFMVPGSDCLCCRLPSGRLLRYWSPRMQQGYWKDGTPKPTLDLTVLQMKGRFGVRRTLWRGLIIENVTQAIAADLLGIALVNCEDAGLPTVLHVHDNAVNELPEQQAIDRLPEFKQCMLAAPAWARGLPIAVEVAVGARFE